MTATGAKLFLVAGKLASGKTTLMRNMAAEPNTVLICEDHLLSGLYDADIRLAENYVRYSGRLKRVIGGHIVSLLRSGMSVALDFPANTVADRKWLCDLAVAAEAQHELHYLDVPDEVCLQRLSSVLKPNSFEPKFCADACERANRRFEPPGDDEGLNIILHSYCTAAKTMHRALEPLADAV